MSKPRRPDTTTLTGQLLAMIDQSGMAINALAVAAGIPQPVLFRFVTGERPSMTLRTADKLCQYFGVRLTTPKGKGEGKERQ